MAAGVAFVAVFDVLDVFVFASAGSVGVDPVAPFVWVVESTADEGFAFVGDALDFTGSAAVAKEANSEIVSAPMTMERRRLRVHRWWSLMARRRAGRDEGMEPPKGLIRSRI